MTTQDPRTIVKVNTRLWSDEVGMVAAQEGPVPLHDPAYEFSNGRKFEEKAHYQDATTYVPP